MITDLIHPACHSERSEESSGIVVGEAAAGSYTAFRMTEFGYPSVLIRAIRG
jgi:hypothetical protein